MFVLEKTKYLEKGKKHFASFSSKEISKKAQFIEHSLSFCRRQFIKFLFHPKITTCHF